MWVVLGLALLFGHNGPSSRWTASRVYERGGWRLVVSHDRFGGEVFCSVRSREVVLKNDTLIFKLRGDAETIDARFRIDAGPVRSVREVLAVDQARGFFPDRGWIEDPSEREVAIPSSYARGARTIWIRANPTVDPRRFRLAGLDAMIRSARRLGCPYRPV